MTDRAVETNWTIQSAVEGYAQAEALFNSIGDGAIATDEFGRITKVNAMALQILSCREKALLGKWLPKTIKAFTDNGEPVPLMDRPITRAFLNGKPVTQKLLFGLNENDLLPVSCTVSPLIQADRPIGAIMLFRDIRLEYEIDRMKSDFISLASHQLRTPLSAIKTYSHMLVDGMLGPLTPPQKKSLRTIVGATNRMNKLISTLLNVSRIESGNVIITPKKVNLNHLVKEVFKEIKLNDSVRSIDFRSHLPTKSVIINGDNLLIKEIIMNLVSNAAKYGKDDGQVLVNITRRPSSHTVLISVKDDGIGIPSSAQNKIFSKFFRASNVVKKETDGTGLGLYLVKGLVEAMGGKIWFKTTEGVGSTFYVELPVSQPKAESTSDNLLAGQELQNDHTSELM